MTCVAHHFTYAELGGTVPKELYARIPQASCGHWRVRVAAGAANSAAAAVQVAVAGKCSTLCSVFSLRCLACLSVCLSACLLACVPACLSVCLSVCLCLSACLLLCLHSPFCVSASSASHWVCSTQLASRLQLHLWLLARLWALIWRCACWIRPRSGSTTLFTTTSSDCSTHRYLRTFGSCSPLLFQPLDVRWIVRTEDTLSESTAILGQSGRMKRRARSSSSFAKRKCRHPAVTLEKKKTMSEDNSPSWRSSLQSFVSPDGKRASKQSRWGDVTR